MGKDLMEDFKISEIIRSKRKTIALIISDNAKLIVKAPDKTSIEEIYEVVKRHRRWIKKHIEFVKGLPKDKEKQFTEGESFLLLGKAYSLFLSRDSETPLKFDNGFYLDERYREKARDLFIDFYKKTAKAIISERVDYYSKLTGIEYKGIKITSAKKRWGSCSRNNNLSFTYNLIMAPLSVIDYVVVHELCHVLEHNHSKNFWDKVKTIKPDYEDAKKWLKEKGHLLYI
jgi:predicted metal-dependent hydrolase